MIYILDEKNVGKIGQLINIIKFLRRIHESTTLNPYNKDIFEQIELNEFNRKYVTALSRVKEGLK